MTDLNWRACVCNNGGLENTENMTHGRSMMGSHEAHCPFSRNGGSSPSASSGRRSRDDQVVKSYEQVCARLDRIEKLLKSMMASWKEGQDASE